jgi:hypothetical protein
MARFCIGGLDGSESMKSISLTMRSFVVNVPISETWNLTYLIRTYGN